MKQSTYFAARGEEGERVHPRLALQIFLQLTGSSYGTNLAELNYQRKFIKIKQEVFQQVCKSKSRISFAEENVFCSLAVIGSKGNLFVYAHTDRLALWKWSAAPKLGARAALVYILPRVI